MSIISGLVVGELAERLGRGLQILLQRFESVTRLLDGKLAERLGRGLQILLQRFESVTCLLGSRKRAFFFVMLCTDRLNTTACA